MLETAHLLQLARELSTAGLETFQKRSRLKKIEFSQKEDDSPVTHLDVALDAALRIIIIDHFPDDRIISEEGDNSPGTMSPPEQPTWWIDPIDGTKEFIKGGSNWVLQLARSVNGQLESAFLIQPAKNKLYYAGLGQGAYEHAIDALKVGWKPKRIQARPPGKSLTAMISASRTDEREESFLKRIKAAKTMKRSSLGLKAVAIARGKADLYANYSGLSHLWDLAAPHLVLQEAGGLVVDGQNPISYLPTQDTLIKHPFVLCHKVLSTRVQGLL